MKILVLGDGLLGSEIVKQTQWDYISRKKDNIDISDFNSITKYFNDYDTILNCIAYTKTYDMDKKRHWDVNYKFVSELTDWCVLNGKKLIHISTDYVYANSIIDASEESVPVHMNSWYTYTKLVADAYIELKSPNYLIIRESHKPYPFPYKEAWFDQYTNGTYVNEIAELIIKLIFTNAIGIYNVGTYSKTWYSLTREEFNTIAIHRSTMAPASTIMNLTKLKNALKRKNK